MNLAQVLLRQPGDATVIILNQEGSPRVTPFLMVLYGTTLVPLVEELWDLYPTLLSPFYANDEVFDWSARRSAAQLRLMMDRGPDQ